MTGLGLLKSAPDPYVFVAFVGRRVMHVLLDLSFRRGGGVPNFDGMRGRRWEAAGSPLQVANHVTKYRCVVR